MADGRPPDAATAPPTSATRASGVPRAAGPGRLPSVLFVFLDGVGLGDDDPARNPLAAARLPRLTHWLGGRPVRGTAPRRTGDGAVVRVLDASLGHDGLPQSATGQTALLSGVNGADLMGGHYGPWPGPTLRRALADGTLFHQAGAGAALANAYPDGYFEAERRRRLRPNVPVVAARAAGVPQRGMDDYRRGEALPPDLTGARLGGVGGGALLAPDASGARLADLARGRPFTFFDLWLTDHLGHERRMDDAVALLEDLDAFLGAVADALGDTTLVVTSDHGNLEDLGHGRHTHNPVPLLALGPGAAAFAGVDDLLGVAPAVRRVWGRRG